MGARQPFSHQVKAVFPAAEEEDEALSIQRPVLYSDLNDLWHRAQPMTTPGGARARHSSYTYVEVEPQGAHQSIPAGGALTWTVHWQLSYLPSNVTPSAGNIDLLNFVRGEIL